MRELEIKALHAYVCAAAIAWTGAAIAAESETAGPESPASEPLNAAPSPGDSLHSLEWLLGEWTGMTDNAVVLVSAHWCDGGAFIERNIVVRPAGQPEIGGTQRIGWDPIRRRIKCWTFDSQGGTGEGYWQREGKSWIVESDEVLADGETSSTISKFTPQGKDRFLWDVERASVDGAILPKQQIEFVRAPQN
jgi:hypothetical protein